MNDKKSPILDTKEICKLIPVLLKKFTSLPPCSDMSVPLQPQTNQKQEY